MSGFLFGFWGVIHSATLNSIGARAYAYETFRHRTHLQYFRITRSDPSDPFTHFYDIGFRRHGVIDGSQANEKIFYARTQFISLNLGLGDADEVTSNDSYHNEGMYQEIVQGRRYSRTGVNPVWSKVLYGICIRPDCGDGSP